MKSLYVYSAASIWLMVRPLCTTGGNMYRGCPSLLDKTAHINLYIIIRNSRCNILRLD